MNYHTGPHSIRELLVLLKEIEFFRYFPRNRNFQDYLECLIPVEDEKDLNSVDEEVTNIAGRHPNLMFSIAGQAKWKRLRITISNGLAPEDLTPKQFQESSEFEKELKAFCSTRNLKLMAPDTTGWGFNAQEFLD